MSDVSTPKRYHAALATGFDLAGCRAKIPYYRELFETGRDLHEATLKILAVTSAPIFKPARFALDSITELV